MENFKKDSKKILFIAFGQLAFAGIIVMIFMLYFAYTSSNQKLENIANKCSISYNVHNEICTDFYSIFKQYKDWLNHNRILIND